MADCFLFFGAIWPAIPKIRMLLPSWSRLTWFGYDLGFLVCLTLQKKLTPNLNFSTFFFPAPLLSGLTQSNYKELNILYGKYKDQGLFVILAGLFSNCIYLCVSFYLYEFEGLNFIADIVVAGFEILAFPSNQFGWQEPGTNEEIQETVCTMFKAEFPIFEKVTLKKITEERASINYNWKKKIQY